MKKLLLTIIAAGMFLAACKQSSKTTNTSDFSATATGASAGTIAVNANPPVMKFENTSHDFGKITQGDKVTYQFSFVNAGKSPLIITDAVASCGCTTPVWPKGPVKPGDRGQIAVTFNSAGKKGLQDKQITITANTNPPQNVVHLVGEVLEKK